MKLSPNALLFVGAVVLFGATTISLRGEIHLPGNNQGYAPEQPLPYSHRLHAGELGINCLYCHFGARTSRHAGIPPTGLCMNCHKVVKAGFEAVAEERVEAEAEGRDPRPIVSPGIVQIYDALGLDDEGQPLPDAEPRPIPWVRVHQLPDFVHFDHSLHVARDLACQTCHGPVESMDRVRQVSDLSMGWCLDCHRASAKDPAGAAPVAGEDDTHVSTDCGSCHF